jgi:MFS family permease
MFSSSLLLFIVASIIYYLNFGGWLSLAPSATISTFGRENYSQNYGFMFTAYGLGALIGNFVTGSIIDNIGMESMYLLMAGISIIGIITLHLFTTTRPSQ